MADSTPSPPAPKRASGAFAAGIAVGVIFGGAILLAIIFFPLMGLLSDRGGSGAPFVFLITYVIGIAIGLWAFYLSKRWLNFWTGLMMGSAAGLLGATALCNVIISLSG